LLDTVYILLFKIQWGILEVQTKSVVCCLKIQKISIEWPLTLACILCFYKLYRLSISKGNLGDLKFWIHWKVTKYVVAIPKEDINLGNLG